MFTGTCSVFFPRKVPSGFFSGQELKEGPSGYLLKNDISETVKRLFATIFLFLIVCENIDSQTVRPDSAGVGINLRNKSDSFYDSLRYRAERKKLTRYLHSVLIRNPKQEEKIREPEESKSPHEGKTIGNIGIVRLDIFGPSIRDTTRKARLWYEKAGNFIQTKSNLNNINKNILFKEGDPLVTTELYENERILRALPYIKDVRFCIVPDTVNENMVNILLITQDRFSFGVTGAVNGAASAALELYNRNIFGIGHELSTRFVGHLSKQPLMGIEAFYRINNLNGKFINCSAGYMNTYLNEGAMATLDKGFLRTSDIWGYGFSGYTYKRTYQFPEMEHSTFADPIGFNIWGGWAGRNFQAGRAEGGSQLTLSGHFLHRRFTDRPPLPSDGGQFFYNNNFYLAGLTWSFREFTPDELIYGYGITEDIPRGFKYELIFGYDDNETGDRLFSQLSLSQGSLFPERLGYYYLSAGLGGYLRSGKVEQGLIEFTSDYISALFPARNPRFRQFIHINYNLGINRFEPEKLIFEKNDLIRGFNSREVSGKQRLNINLETVYFQRREFYRFNMAFFAFADVGVIGPEKSWITNGSYYSGLGIGMRLHNESMVFKTIQLRISFYPNHPEDVGPIGFLLNEHTRRRFYSFQPGPPAPAKFE